MTERANQRGLADTPGPANDTGPAAGSGVTGARVGVVTFPGTLDDRDAARAITIAGATAVPLWHADTDLAGVDAVVIPGGFSYGDYLRSGAISRFAPMMGRIVAAANSNAKLPVLGICNGFQILTEAHLLPGSMLKNDHLKFICRDQRLRIENANTAWTCAFADRAEITVPLKNQDGQYVADPDTLAQLEAENRVVFRYLGLNPNGSRNDIAGISNQDGTVVGLMPHPEHAVEPGFGPTVGDGSRFGPGTGADGLGLFTSVISTLQSGASA